MSSPRGLWHRLPFVIQTVLVALVVTAAAGFPWSVLASANAELSPSLPWAAGVMSLWLIAYCWYLSGQGEPQTSQNWRRARFRQTHLSGPEWFWSVIAGAFAITSLIAAQFVLLRLVHLPLRPQPVFPGIPIHTILSLGIMSALVSGISEEVGFRGYMQVTLEQRRGPAFAILLTSFVFMLAHLNHGLSFGLVFDFAYGSVFGLLAYRINSILPGIVLHSGFDVIQFVAGKRLASAARALPLLWDAGLDRWFLTECSAGIILGVGAFVAFRKLPRGKR